MFGEDLEKNGAKAFLWVKLFSNRKNFIRLASLLSVIAAGLIILIKELGDPIADIYRSNIAYLTYAIFILIALLIEAKSFFRPNSSPTRITSVLIGIILTTRFFTSITICMAVAAPALHQGSSLINAFLAAFPFCFAAMGGFALNDFTDYKQDLINRPKRAIPSGKLSRLSVLIISISLISISIVLSLAISESFHELLLYMATIVGVSFYNKFVQKYSHLKVLYTAVLCSIPIIYVVLIFNYDGIYLLLPLSTTLYILGRELLMDIRDMAGDYMQGIKTIPLIIGKKLTGNVAFFFQFLSVMLLLPIAMLDFVIPKIFLWTLITVLTTIFYFLWNNYPIKYNPIIINCMQLPMIGGILMLII